MPSTFFGLNIATSGIYAASVNLNVTANNVANQTTKGYARQEATQVSKQALRVYQEYGMIGAGVHVTSIDRVRDTFYDQKYWTNQSKLGTSHVKNYYMSQIENTMNEFAVDGFTKEYTNFFESLEELQKYPENMAARTSALTFGQSMMRFLEQVKTELRLQQEDINAEISDHVDKINTLATELASLNKQINIIELTGAAANELRDKRDLILDEMNEIVDVQTSEKIYPNGKSEFTVSIGSNTLVSTYDTFQLKVVTREDKVNEDDPVGMYDIYWDYGQEFNPIKEGINGALNGLLNVRDGNNQIKSDSEASYEIDYKGIVYYINEITKFQRAFTNAMNEIHCAGENRYGDSTADIPLFVEKEGNVFDINTDLLDDPMKMATAYHYADGASSDDLAKDLLGMKDKILLEGSTSEEFLQSLVTELGVEVKKVQTLEKSYTNFQTVIQNQRLSVMGVDGDEEAMNLVKYREAFNLNSKVISVMQEVYDKLINQTGV